MPTYQYVCTECGGQIEAVQKFTDDPLTMHEACGGRLRKVFSPVGIVFKGSGFYRTDSRSGSASPAASSSDSSSSSAASSSSSENGGSGKDAGAKDAGAKDGGGKDGGAKGGGEKNSSPGSSSAGSSPSTGAKVA